jgi:riboflavin biosynthesis pyrimidine reductase
MAGASLERVRTVVDRSGAFPVRAVGDAWSLAAFDGPFFETVPDAGLSTGVVFVRSRDGDTATRNPAALGGGAVDEHLIYEGLTRVAVDAVIVGAATLHRDALFTVWRSELVELRRSLGLPRHPAQVVMSADGSVQPDQALLFNLPDTPVYVLTSPRGRERLAAALDERPWATAIAGTSLEEQFAALRQAGMRRVCSVGGRRSATALVDAGLVHDVYLTTTSVAGAEPGTPWYAGSRELHLRTVVVKQWEGRHGVVTFEHGVL